MLQYSLACLIPLPVDRDAMGQISHIAQHASPIQHGVLIGDKSVISGMRADICKELLQKLEWKPGGGIGSEAGIRIVEIRVRDATRVGPSFVETLASGTSSDVIEKLHGSW